MMKYLSNKLITKLIQLGNIKEDESELYTYGLQQSIFIILNVLTILFIGLLFGMLWQSIVFMSIYLPLRSFAGGFHAKSPLFCYIYSIILILAVLLSIKYIPWSNSICLFLLAFACIVILILSPVEDLNKPLDQIEVVTYRKRTLIILTLELMIYFILLGFKQNGILPIISVSLFTLSILLILGKIKNVKQG